ncbi:hypothetical protein TNCV_354771 [Trichonephila clavipes]|uniref:Uncharacterized protein n=1 Tax=Trichonephila clavipes TaxID=2585209 RepID=A0A8X7BBP9_TRICX|nr:hypothetical protein TNCV_354771 [Trichonephila clavipes]
MVVPLCCKWVSNDDQRGPAVKRNGTPDHNSLLRACGAIMKVGSARCPGLGFQRDRAKHLYNLALPCAGVNGRWRSGWYEQNFCSFCRLGMVIVDTRVWVARLMVDNDESGTVTADLTINMSSRSAGALGRPLPS